MNKTDYIFWTVLGIIAIFYLTKGNSMHEERYQFLQEKKHIESKN